VRVRIERTFLTTDGGTRMIHVRPDFFTVEAESLRAALVEFIASEGGKLLGTVSEHGQRAVATAWKNRVYLLSAQPAPD
jgi:hypothetical protein